MVILKKVAKRAELQLVPKGGSIFGDIVKLADARTQTCQDGIPIIERE